MMSPIPSATNDFQADHIHLLLSSFEQFVGRPLLSSDRKSRAELARELFEAPFVVVSHDTAPDPIFNYGNRRALKLFEMTWEEFTGLPSRKSAEPVQREERDRLLAAVSDRNFIDDYSGIRISSTGRRFYIPSATVWNVVDGQGIHHGQAATFSQWQFL